jgi:hypothetical protein
MPATTMEPTRTGIGGSLEQYQSIFGAVVGVDEYRPDLYPTSYDLKHGYASIKVTPLPDVIACIEVCYSVAPTEPIEDILALYSGITGWQPRPLSDPHFRENYPAFSTKADGNLFFTAPGAFALAQRHVGVGELALWIQAEGFLDRIEKHRERLSG